MLLQIVGQSFADSLLHCSRDLAIAELRLGLTLKLGLSHLDGDDGRQALTEVVAHNVDLRLLNLL